MADNNNFTRPIDAVRHAERQAKLMRRVLCVVIYNERFQVRTREFARHNRMMVLETVNPGIGG